MSTLTRLIRYVKPYWLPLLGGGVALCVSVVLELVPPMVWKYIVDEGVIHRRAAAILPAVIGLVLLYGAFAAATAVRSLLLERVAQHFGFDLRAALFEKLSRQSLAYFHHARTGDLISRATSDVETVQTLISFGVDSGLGNAARLAAITVILCVLNLKLALVMLLPGLLIGLLFRWFNARIRGVYRSVRDAMGELNTRLHDSLSGVRVVKQFVQEAVEVQSLRQAAQDYVQRYLRAIGARALFIGFNRWLSSLGGVLLLGAGAWLILRGELTLGGLVAFRAYGQYVFSPIGDLAQANDLMQRAAAAAERIFEVLDAPESVCDARDAVELQSAAGDIVFDDVWFSYSPDASPVFRGLSLHIRAGETVGLVGESGAGKTTLFALLSRFWDPERGAVRIDGQPLTGVTQVSLRRHIACVQQDTFLFAATIAENIRYGCPGASDEQVQSAARAANAHPFIQELPQGYETTVGERGVKLSGGQRQRICIARALLMDATILLLDEATSAVEAASEQIINDALERSRRGRTTIIATHRLSTLRRVDRIAVLKDGRVAESGAPDELLRRGGLYAAMVARGSLADEDGVVAEAALAVTGS